ncbi:hypothetical protein [Penaeicola halotolerans]|uniref:hypothetical protein n=1 Tax=Penaeicola halotolerans TaxID=2793196 RepID=UPI001CF82CA1|nr:hypothetical protein [Penaeicola halotolerans]
MFERIRIIFLVGFILPILLSGCYIDTNSEERYFNEIANWYLDDVYHKVNEFPKYDQGMTYILWDQNETSNRVQKRIVEILKEQPSLILVSNFDDQQAEISFKQEYELKNDIFSIPELSEYDFDTPFAFHFALVPSSGKYTIKHIFVLKNKYLNADAITKYRSVDPGKRMIAYSPISAAVNALVDEVAEYFE